MTEEEVSCGLNKRRNNMKKYRVVLHQEYTVEAANERAAISIAEILGLGNEYEIALDTTVEELADDEEDINEGNKLCIKRK